MKTTAPVHHGRACLAAILAVFALAGCRGENSPTDPAAEHKGQDKHETGIVQLSAEAMRNHGVEVAVAAGGGLQRTITVPANGALIS